MKALLLVKAVICFAFGLGMITVPGPVMAVYGVALDFPGEMITRWFAALLLGIGVLCLSTRAMTVSKDQKGVLLSLFVADTLGFVVALVAQINGMMNALGWVDVAIWLVLALFLGYFRFLSKTDT